ncbi:unnamed protein product [Rhizophagus irregularis]|nr:unnamed protein product [Rhizophagus irregularis]
MSSEPLKERQKMLQRERQQRCRQLKRQNGKENIQPYPKRRKNDEINELPKILKARIYPWIQDGLERHTLGNMDHECFNCGAMMWLDERVNISTKLPVFATCCAKGKILLPPMQGLLPPLDRLLTGMDSHARTKIDDHITGTRGVYTFRIHGEMYHSIGTLLPNDEEHP